MKKTLTLPIAVAATLGSMTTAQAQEEISLRLPWLLNVQAAGYVMADAKGFYEEAGLDVEILPGGPNLNSTALVASGANTFGTNDVNGIVMGVQEQMDLVMVAACFQKHPAGVITLAAENIAEPADLVGKKLAYNEGGPWTLTKAMLGREGVSLDDIELIVSPSTELLINGNVDAKTGFTVNEPIAVELAGIETSVLLPSDYGVDTSAEAIFTTRAFAEENPELVQAFVDATIRGYDYAYANQEETVQTVLEYNNQLDPAQQTEQLRRQESYVFDDFATEHGACAYKTNVVADTIEVLNTYGGMEITVDPASVYSTEFVYTE
ncbi:MAG: ABC transporter substrate-binding protein [Pseudomonadota bacterium]|nr:ABC transporter substrate-binding protein [Pseudomonadota bacterium]